MATYLLQVTISWLFFLLLYFVMFRKETFFRLNRWYLITTLIAGLLIPLAQYISINALFESSPAVEYVYYLNQGFDQFEVTITAAAENSAFGFSSLLVLIYAIGVCLLIVRFFYGLVRILNVYKNGITSSYKQFELIQSNTIKSPFSFLNKIFIPTQLDQLDESSKKMLTHEQCHCEEWHSADVLLLEVLNILFWFNPLIYIYKKELKSVHEYIADDYVLKFSDVQAYGQLLLQNLNPVASNFLENQFYNAQIKNRIMMMTKIKSPKTSLLKYITVLPLMLGICFLFTSCDLTGQEEVHDITESPEVFKVVEQMPEFPGCNDVDASEQKKCRQKEMLMFIYKNIKYPEAARKEGLQGTNIVRFIVEKDGSISNEEMTKSIGGGTDVECLRVVRSMPKWLPGKQRGVPVRVQFNLPIKFKLEDNGDASKKKTESIDGKVYKEPDNMPYFADCPEDKDMDAHDKQCTTKKMLEFIYKGIKYPEAARKKGTEGVVVLSFIIDKDGSMRDPKIERSVADGCDDAVMEVFRQFQSSPDMKWMPGTVDGKPVHVQYMLPVKFKTH